MKVVTVVGTRPEIIKLSEVIKKLDNSFDHILVHTGQNYDYELNQVFFEDLGVRQPDYFLEASKESPALAIGDIISKSDECFRTINPDALLIYGDTNSCLCVISAKRLKIPIFHMEAGNRCFDQRVPEEINRKIVDHLSDINLPLSEHARGYLIAEGIGADRIIKTGSPMPEVLRRHEEAIENSDALKKLKLTSRGYLLMSIHREENVDISGNFLKLLDSIEQLSLRFKIPVVISTHPRTKKRLEELGIEKINDFVMFLKPFGFFDYNNLQKNALCVISDSGTITEESSFFNLPAVTIRQAHERPEGMDETTVIMSGLESERVIQAVELAIDNHVNSPGVIRSIKDYEPENVSVKIVRIIVSYVDFINRVVWAKKGL